MAADLLTAPPPHPAAGMDRPGLNNPLTVYLDSLAPTGRRSMRSLLGRAAALLGFEGPLEDLPWGQLRYADVARVRAERLQAGKSINTVNATLAALRGVLNAALLLGQLPAEEGPRVRAIPRVKGKRLPAGRRLQEVEVSRLLRACCRDDTAMGARDGAIIALMAFAGLRRSEVIGLDGGDYERGTGRLRIRQGKGSRDREMLLPKAVRERLQRWLAWRGKGPGSLFCGVRTHTPLMTHRLSSQAVYGIIRRRAAEAKIAPCSPHDLRRTFITRLLEVGVDLNTTRQLAGHEDLQTTARYDRREIAVQRRALARLHR